MFGSVSKISERVVLEGVKGIGSLPKPSDKTSLEQTAKVGPRRSQPSQA